MSDVAHLQAERERLKALVHRLAQDETTTAQEFFDAVAEQGRVMLALTRAQQGESLAS